jgi:hypothetical protein
VNLRRRIPLVVLLAVVAVLAVGTHRQGIGWGDDFALYARQARAIFDGDIARVIIDNRFNVDNAARPGFSPYVYPWAWPLALSPFVRLWGLDWDRLALASVGCLVGFLACLNALASRRMGRWPALALVAAIGTTLAYLTHTGTILSELPFMFAAAGTMCWIDHCRDGDRLLLDATRRRLIVLGLFAALVFNIRREGIAMVAAIAAVQAVESLTGRRRPSRSVLTPYLAFAGAVAIFQLLLPSALLPSYEGAGLGQVTRKLGGSIRASFADQLGFPDLGSAWLRVVVVLAIGGVTVRLLRHAAEDVALVVFPVLTVVIAGMVPAESVRYTMTFTPFAVYFAAQALRSIPRVGDELVLGALVAVTVLHVQDTVPEIREAQRFNDRGMVVAGPVTPSSEELWAAIRDHTHQDDVIGTFKSRVLTLYTDRRGVQSGVIDVVDQRSDFAVTAQRRGIGVGEITISADEAAERGWTEVWSNDDWVLWRIRENGGS